MLVHTGYVEINDRIVRTTSFLDKGDFSSFTLPSKYNTNR